MFTSASSGPLLTFCFGIMAFMFWPIRKSMRKVRWASSPVSPPFRSQ